MCQKALIRERLKLPLPKKIKEEDTIFTDWENIKNQYKGIGNIPFELLGEYLDRWSNLTTYTRWLESLADIKLTTTREIRDTVKKQLYTLQEGSRELRDAMVHTEELFIEFSSQTGSSIFQN